MVEKHYLEREFDELMTDPDTVRFLDGGALDGLWYWDIENPEHEWMSPGFWRTLGFDPGERQHLAAEWQDLIFPEDRDEALANFERHLADPDHPYDQLVRYQTAEGGTVTVRCRGKAIRKDGVPKRMLGAHTVVHDTRQHEVTRQLSELLELSNDAILAWSASGGVQRWNRGAERLYGFRRSEAMGRDPLDFLRPTFPDGWHAVEACLSEGRQWEGTVAWRRADGKEVFTSSRFQRLEITTGDTLILQIDRDMTDRQRAEERQRVLARELNHRVKNLFAIVQALVAMSARDETDVTVLTKKIRNRVAALATAHAASMSEAGLQPVPLREIVASVLGPYGGGDDRLCAEGPDALIGQEAVTPMGLILHELATNAAKYGAWSDEGGRVEVRWELLPADQCELTWRERCSHPVNVTSGKMLPGFGTRLVDQSVVQVGGTLERRWHEDGLEAVFRFPVAQGEKE